MADATFHTTFSDGDNFTTEFYINDDFVSSLDDVVVIPEHPYTGTYEVTPTDYEQTLPTKDRSMLDDVTVHATPYGETYNPEGGYTATIL